MLRKNLTVKVRLLDGSTVVRKVRAPAHKQLTDKGVDQILETLGAQAEEAFPDKQFRLVPLRDGNFNFVEIKAGQESFTIEAAPCGPPGSITV